MKQIDPQSIKSILHSKRANIYYLEYCRVLVNGGRVEYVTEQGKKQLYWNIPIANTSVILLGTGTSLTQAAMRELARAGVMVGFSGGGGTPLFAGTDAQIDIEWLSPQSEYRPTEYLQQWTRFWFDDALRLQAAKKIQLLRLEFLESVWLNPQRANLKDLWSVDKIALLELTESSRERIRGAQDTTNLLTEEARVTKRLYAIACNETSYGEFKREGGSKTPDRANRFLDHGNYLAYGLGATALWVLGIPFGLAVLHGKTRRGGLVFDVADLVKDAVILPNAFIHAVEGSREQEFRDACIASLTQCEALDHMIDSIKQVAIELGRKAQISS